MDLDNERESNYIEDRRGQSGSGIGRGFRGGFGGFGGRRLRGRGGMSLGTLVIVGVIMYAMGLNPLTLLTGGDPTQGFNTQRTSTNASSTSKNDPLKTFVAKVLGTTERSWSKRFQAQGQRYKPAPLVLFTGRVNSACGSASSAVGPFYCPGDSKIYIDLSFFRDLSNKFGAPGDFAQAYVIAHEVGHHLQNILGISGKVQRARRSLSKRESNALSVKLELQADCFAGIWAHDNKLLLEPGDIEEGLGAANAIGDDRLQRRSQGTVVPESFTHGSSAQRVKWFKRGLERGSMQACNTFS